MNALNKYEKQKKASVFSLRRNATSDELQKRLFNSFEVDPVTKDIPRDRHGIEHRYSLRGVSFAERGRRGVDYDLVLQEENILLMKKASTKYYVLEDSSNLNIVILKIL